MASWKSEIFTAIVKHKIDQVNALLDAGIPKEKITIYYAEDCVYCSGNLEYTLNLSQGQNGIDGILQDLKHMIDGGHCMCEINHESEGGALHGVNLLHLACTYGPPSLVRRLIDDGYNVNDTSLMAEFTPLHYVAQSQLSTEDAIDVARVLLEAGAALNQPDKKRNIPLHLAIQGHSELALELIQDSVCDAENESGETPLLVAVKMADKEVVEKLIKSNANVNIKDRNDMLAVNIAIHKDNQRMVNALLSSPTCDPNLVGVARNGLRPMCPLLYATCRENREAVDLLLKKGAFVDCIDNDDSQPLLIAAYTDNITIGRMLINHGADVNMAPQQAYSPLHHAAWEGHLNMCHLLLEAGALHDTQTSDKNTPLALACHGDFPDTIRLLLSRGCNVNNQDKDLDAPIHYCTYNSRHEGVRLLINHGADPDIENAYQVTPLWNAIFRGDTKSTELLIHCNVRLSIASRGIDQHAQTENPTLIYDKPRTPLYIACAKNHRKLAVMLLMAGAELKDEKWFWGADFPQALRNEAALLHWVSQQATQPQSLLRISRNVIRRLLGVHPQRKIERLEIPMVLKHFLLIKSFDRDL